MKKDIILWGLWIVILIGGITSAYETSNDIDKNYKSLQGVNRSLKELEKKVESKTYNFDSINVVLQGLRTSINDINARLDSNDDRFRTSVGEINDILQELDGLINSPVEEPIEEYVEELGVNAGFGELTGTLATGNGGEGILSVGVSEPVETTEPITINEYIPPKTCTVPKTDLNMSDFLGNIYLSRPLEFIAEFDLVNGEPIDLEFVGSSNRDTRKAVTKYINAIDFGTETIKGCKIPFKFTL
jgi:hypothetical protein